MTNFDADYRELITTEAMTDISLDTMGNQNSIFDLAADHFGSDDDAHYMIHLNATIGFEPGELITPRSIAFLRLLKHIPADCTECD